MSFSYPTIDINVINELSDIYSIVDNNKNMIDKKITRLNKKTDVIHELLNNYRQIDSNKVFNDKMLKEIQMLNEKCNNLEKKFVLSKIEIIKLSDKYLNMKKKYDQCKKELDYLKKKV